MYTQESLTEGKYRYAVITLDAEMYRISADSEEEAKDKVEEVFGIDVHKVTLITAWSGGSVEAK